jgi:hypothetical protein
MFFRFCFFLFYVWASFWHLEECSVPDRSWASTWLCSLIRWSLTTLCPSVEKINMDLLLSYLCKYQFILAPVEAAYPNILNWKLCFIFIGLNFHIPLVWVNLANLTCRWIWQLLVHIQIKKMRTQSSSFFESLLSFFFYCSFLHRYIFLGRCN